MANSSSFDFRELLGVGLKYRWTIVGLTVLSTVLALAWTVRQPKIYEATCSLEYDPSPPRPLGREVEDVAEPVSNFWLTQEFYETQNKILESRQVAEKVVRKLALHHDPGFFRVAADKRASWKGRTVAAAAQRLQLQVRVEQVKETRIVVIHVEDTNAQRAATLANAIAEAYIEKTVEDRLGSTVDALEWLNKQLGSLRSELENAENALHDFKLENNVLSVALEDRQNIVANQIQQFTQTLTEARAKRIELGARLETLRKADRTNPLAVSVSEIDHHEGIMALRSQYRTKSAEHASLAKRYGEAHPKMLSLSAEIDALRKQIEGSIAGVVESADADLTEARRFETGLRRELDQANRAGLELNLREIEYQRLNRQRQNKAKLHAILLERTAETNLTKMLRIAVVRIVDRALKPALPVKPRVHINLSLGVIAGLFAGLGLAFVLSRMDRTLKSAADAEALGATVLGALPTIGGGRKKGRKFRKSKDARSRYEPQDISESRDLIVHTHPRSAVAECCRTVRTNLTFMGADRALEVLEITSAEPREGKTTVAVSLAIAMAQSGKRVLLIDTDMRRPRIHRAFGLGSDVGVTSVLVGEQALSDCAAETEVPNLFVLPCGPVPPNPAELLHTPQFRDLVAEARRTFDRVILDSPPLGAVTDAAIVGPQVDGTVLVVKMGETSRDAAASVIKRLRDVGANVVGTVLNQIDASASRYGYNGGGYYYYRREGYYAPGDEHQPQASA